MTNEVHEAHVDLYWLPLGAGGSCVRHCGHAFEALGARRERRVARDLYHSALAIAFDGASYVIEMAPVWNVRDHDRGAVVEGPVGTAWLGRSRWFRYEVRRWRDGRIPDIAAAVDSPQRLSDDRNQAALLLCALDDVPALTWGRDEMHTGDMWNSNSLVSWALATAGFDINGIRPPAGGRAPGWTAGLVLASRQLVDQHQHPVTVGAEH